MSVFCRNVRGGLNAEFSSEEKYVLILDFRGSLRIFVIEIRM